MRHAALRAVSSVTSSERTRFMLVLDVVLFVVDFMAEIGSMAVMCHAGRIEKSRLTTMETTKAKAASSR